MHASINVIFVAGFCPVVKDQPAAEHLYRGLLRLPLESVENCGGYRHTDKIEGVKRFALWPLDKAAKSCFGQSRWPEDVPGPQSRLELEVDNLESATRLLEESGCRLLTRLQEEPWGQTVTRFLSPEGILAAVTHTPFLRSE